MKVNIPIGSIQRILGRENRTTTEIYLHSIGDGEKNATEILNDQFADNDLKKSPAPTKKGLDNSVITT